MVKEAEMKAFGYLAAGIGIGAALAMLLAPEAGNEVRRRIANKCFDTVDAANNKVWQSRVHVRDMMNKGQQEITKAVAAGREAVGKPKTAETRAAVS
jgi:gas vesicle protein